MEGFSNFRAILTQFFGQQNMITVPRPLIQFLDGDLHAAMLLNQIIFWSDWAEDQRQSPWFYKTYEDWQKEICLSEKQTRAAAYKLRERGFIQMGKRKVEGSPKMHWRSVWQNIEPALLEYAKKSEKPLRDMDSAKSAGTIRPNVPNGTGQNGRMVPAESAVSSYTEKTYRDNIQQHTGVDRSVVKLVDLFIAKTHSEEDKQVLISMFQKLVKVYGYVLLESKIEVLGTMNVRRPIAELQAALKDDWRPEERGAQHGTIASNTGTDAAWDAIEESFYGNSR